ncbi:nucleotidyltransferase domain-containing protein [Larkinella sp. VNQ87]|uniref:nucleotidyltransferase domain-containing protein n=1 Tax=Larkinella sp. VNQ87 TaxID=3400921 RepID=UPI003C007561
MIDQRIAPILEELKTSLKALYGNRLAQILLYGSYARGDFHDESDIDILVVLRQKTVDTYEEILRTADLVTALNLKYSSIISLLYVTENRFLRSQMPVYQEIRNEGLTV